MRRIKKGKAWGAQERLRYLDKLAYWRGMVRRADLMTRFGISVQMASADIKAYRAANPKALQYDSQEKRYVSSDGMTPLFDTPVLDDALHLLADRSMNSGPWVDVVAPPHREVGIRTAQAVFRAVAYGRSLEIRYASLNSATFRWRWVTPHAFASDGFRWHVRAYCHEDKIFKDFVMGRIAETRCNGAPAAAPGSDLQWVNVLRVNLKPAAELSAEEITALQLDFGLKDNILTLEVREALLPYHLAQLGLDPEGRQMKKRFSLVR